MEVFPIRMPDGSVQQFRANTPEEAYGLSQQLIRQQRGRELTHPAVPATREQMLIDNAAQVFSLPPGQIDLGNTVGPLEAAGEGFLSDNPAEAERYYRMVNPGARVADVGTGITAYLPPGASAPTFSSAPGADWATDPARLVGAAALPTAGAVGGSFISPVLGTAGGAAAAEGLREGVQRAFGTAEEGIGPVAGRMAAAGLFEAGGQLAPKGVAALLNKITKRGATLPTEKAALEEVQVLLQAKAEGLEVPDLMRFQFSEHPTMKALYAQVMQMSPEAAAKHLDQLKAVGRVARGELDSVSESADKIVQRQMREQYESLKPAYPRAETGGESAIGAVEESLKGRKAVMGKEFDRMDELVNRWQPKYDLSAAQKSAATRRVEALPLTKEDVADLAAPDQTITELVNVADPNRKLARINAVLETLDPAQDYAAVKDLRSQVGQLLNMPAKQRMESSLNIGQAKAVYGDLSEAMLNPQGVTAGAAKGLRAQAIKTNRVAKDYYDTYDQNQVSKALTASEGQNPAELFWQLAENPAALPKAFRKVVDEGTLADQVNMRANLQDVILSSDDPLKTLEDWKRGNQDAYRWLFPDKRSRQQAGDTARFVKELNSGPLRKAWELDSEKTGFARYALKEQATGPKESARLMQGLLADSEARTAYRQAVIQEIIQPSFSTNPKHYVRSLDPSKMRSAIDAAKTAGWWDNILTKGDRAKMEAQAQLAKRIWKSGDAGTALTVAASVGGIRTLDPVKASKAIGDVRLAELMAKIAIADVPLEAFASKLPGGKSPFQFSQFGRVLTPFIEGTRATVGEKTDELRRRATGTELAPY